jgi:hypothetical protein
MPRKRTLRAGTLNVWFEGRSHEVNDCGSNAQQFGDNMKTRLLKGLVVGSICVVGGILLLGLHTCERVIPLGGGGTIRVKTASFFGAWLWGTCDVKYQPSNGLSGIISLTDSRGDYPVLIIPKDGGKVLLCLFQLEDMCCQLVRFDTTKCFESLPLHGNLGEIVQNSPWEVEAGNLDDFKYLCDFAKNATPNDLEKNAVPFPDFGISGFVENRAGANKSDILFDLNGVAANWDSLHR